MSAEIDEFGDLYIEDQNGARVGVWLHNPHHLALGNEGDYSTLLNADDAKAMIAHLQRWVDEREQADQSGESR